MNFLDPKRRDVFLSFVSRIDRHDGCSILCRVGLICEFDSSSDENIPCCPDCLMATLTKQAGEGGKEPLESKRKKYL
jgi:hypothetical protein